MAEYIYNRDGYCRAKTKRAQFLCKLGHQDEFDEHCQFMRWDKRCQFAGKHVNKKGEIVKNPKCEKCGCDATKQVERLPYESWYKCSECGHTFKA